MQFSPTRQIQLDRHFAKAELAAAKRNIPYTSSAAKTMDRTQFSGDQSHSADLDADLHIAVLHNEPEEVLQALKKGGNAKLLFSTDKRTFPERPVLEILKLVLFKPDPPSQENLLHKLMQKPSPNLKIIDLLLDAGLDINAKSKPEERTALHIALENPNPSIKVLQHLLSKGADVNARNERGDTPLHVIMCHKSPKDKALDLLLKNGVDVKLENQFKQTAEDQYFSLHEYCPAIITYKLSDAEVALSKLAPKAMKKDDEPSFLSSIFQRLKNTVLGLLQALKNLFAPTAKNKQV